MTCPKIIAMMIAALVLAGCVDNRDVQSMKSDYISLSQEVDYLKARMTAIETACLQINTKLVDLQDRKIAPEQAATSKSTAVTASTKETEAAAQTEHVTLLSESKPADKLTRASFNRLVGMTVSEVLTMLGKPDSVSEEAGVQSWSYSRLSLSKESGGMEHSPALIVFEGGCVARAALTKDAR